MTDTKRRITEDDLLKLSLVGYPQISPDGTRFAFVRRHVDRDKNKYRSELWLGQADGSEAPRRWTGGAWSDGGPRWSPDSSQIAFVSDRQDEKAQIFLLPMGGGEARALTQLAEGAVHGLHWSPDGTQIAFFFRATTDAYTKKAVEERKEKGLSSPPRIHTRLNYRLDGFGYWDDAYWQVWIADVETSETRALTNGGFSCGDLCWSPDGTTLAFLSDRRPDGDADKEGDAQIWTVPATGGEICPIPSPPGGKHGLAWSPDGAHLAYVGSSDPLDSWGTRNDRVYILPTSGAGEARDLTGHTDKAVGFLTLSDTRDNGGQVVVWSADSARLFFPVSENGSTHLYEVSVAGCELMKLTPEDMELGSFSVSSDAGKFALTLGSATAPHETFVGTISNGDIALRQASDLNHDWRAEVALETPEPFAIDNGVGGTVPGWFLFPPDFRADGTAPLVMYVHGGPHLQYGDTLFHELQWLAAQGYVVAYANPRGSKGYGEAHTRAIKGDWGGPALADIEAVADEALRRGYAHPDRQAIMGGSYGGYLTAWAVGHTNRFACAIADRLVGNLQSMSGTSDFAWSHGTYYAGNAWDDPSDLWRHSPQAFAGRIETPLLLIHSDGDLRCPISQAEELFAALRLQKKPVEFVRYPAETSHGLSRNGPPDLRLDRLSRNRDWLDRYLCVKAS
jgi:dipeptidyl aminopeptidase/acylaminoacyl peptidase